MISTLQWEVPLGVFKCWLQTYIEARKQPHPSVLLVLLRKAFPRPSACRSKQSGWPLSPIYLSLQPQHRITHMHLDFSHGVSIKLMFVWQTLTNWAISLTPNYLVCLFVCLFTKEHACGGQKTTPWSWFSPSIFPQLWEITLSASGLYDQHLDPLSHLSSPSTTIFKIYLCVWVFPLHVYMCIMCSWCPLAQKRVS